jgi:hypothetical protein
MNNFLVAFVLVAQIPELFLISGRTLFIPLFASIDEIIAHRVLIGSKNL